MEKPALSAFILRNQGLIDVHIFGRHCLTSASQCWVNIDVDPCQLAVYTRVSKSLFFGRSVISAHRSIFISDFGISYIGISVWPVYPWPWYFENVISVWLRNTYDLGTSTIMSYWYIWVTSVCPWHKYIDSHVIMVPRCDFGVLVTYVYWQPRHNGTSVWFRCTRDLRILTAMS